MDSSPLAHPSRTSVDSMTPLGNSYRPPPKDYAAAFGALQSTYGTTGATAAVAIAKPQKSAKKTPAQKPTLGTSESGATTEADSLAGKTGRAKAKAMGKKVVKAVWVALKAVFGRGNILCDQWQNQQAGARIAAVLEEKTFIWAESRDSSTEYPNSRELGAKMLAHKKYPVLTLPPELVSEIFVSFLPSYPEIPPQFGPLSPLFLCQICRRWRAIAISTPDLWRAIPLGVSDISSKEELDTDAQFEIADTWLARSATRPLSIRLIGSISDPYSDDSFILSILLDKILIHTQRWEYLHLVVPSDLFALVEGSMPLLRALTIGPAPNMHSERPTTLTPFHCAPELQAVLLTESFLTAALTLPWAQLTRLESRCLYVSECRSILEAAPQLVYCQFTVCDGDEIEPELPAIIIQTRLCHLILDIYKTVQSDVDLDVLLGMFTLPALRTLEVFEPYFSREALTGFMSRSRCALEQLSVTGSSLPAMSRYKPSDSVGGFIS